MGAHCRSRCPRGVAVGGTSALNGAVMQRFERVVALPDTKNCGIPAKSTLRGKSGRT